MSNNYIILRGARPNGADPTCGSATRSPDRRDRPGPPVRTEPIADPTSVAAATPRSKTASDENFPVASWLIAPALRADIRAFYRFARAADDIADAPGALAQRRLAALEAVELTLVGAPDEVPPDDGEPDPLAARAIAAAAELRTLWHDTPRAPLLDQAGKLLQAFAQDCRKNRYRSWSELLLYCQYSANPVGRVLLELHGESPAPRRAADALCTALQILNHVQDCRDDIRERDRVYLPMDWLRSAGATVANLGAAQTSPALRIALDRALDGVAALLATASPLPTLIRDRRLAAEAAVILALARRLARRLRHADPLARRVRLGRFDKSVALAVGLWRLARL